MSSKTVAAVLMPMALSVLWSSFLDDVFWLIFSASTTSSYHFYCSQVSFVNQGSLSLFPDVSSVSCSLLLGSAPPFIWCRGTICSLFSGSGVDRQHKALLPTKSLGSRVTRPREKHVVTLLYYKVTVWNVSDTGSHSHFPPGATACSVQTSSAPNLLVLCCNNGSCRQLG